MKRKKIKITRTDLFIYKGKQSNGSRANHAQSDPTTSMGTATATGVVC